MSARPPTSVGANAGWRDGPTATDQAASLTPTDPASVPKSTRRYLLDSERLVFAVRRHPAVLIRPTAIAVLPFALAILLLVVGRNSQIVAVLGLALLLGTLGWYGWKVGDWAVERFTVTDRRVLLITGLLTRRVAIMPLRKVTDLTFERSVSGRLMGYGAFVMESAGQHQALSRIDYLPQPERLYGEMSDLLFGRRGAASANRDANLQDDDDHDWDQHRASDRDHHRGQDETATARFGGNRPGEESWSGGVVPGSRPHRRDTSPLPDLTRNRAAPRRPRAPW